MWRGKIGKVQDNSMGEDSIKIEKIKYFLSSLSMAVLAIQHLIGIFAKPDNIHISYVPLIITFSSFFIGSLESDKMKGIKYISAFGIFLVALVGIIILLLSEQGIKISGTTDIIINRVMFGFIGVISLILAILYVIRLPKVD